MAKSITLHSIDIELTDGISRLEFNYSIGDSEGQIFFEVEEKYGEFLCHERSDAFIICFLPYAMLNGYDIKTSIPVSHDLLYNLSMYLIPILVRYNTELSATRILAPIVADNIGSHRGGLCISFSGGVDSFYTLMKHIQSGQMKDIPWYLFSNDISGLVNFSSDKKDKHFEKVLEFANELSLPLVAARSNVLPIVTKKMDESSAQPFMSAFGMYCLRKLWSMCLFSSIGTPFNLTNVDFAFKSKKPFHLREERKPENFFLQYLSTPGLRIYSAGLEATRNERLDYISDFPIVQKYLSVCLASTVNCNKCSKCRRTLLALDALGKLDKFGSVFDIEYYKANRPEYYQYMFDRAVANDKFYQEILDRLTEQIPKDEYDKYLKAAKDKLKPKPKIQHVPETFSLKYKRKMIRAVIKGLVDNKRYKKLKKSPNKFFGDSKSKFIRFLGRYYN